MRTARALGSLAACVFVSVVGRAAAAPPENEERVAAIDLGAPTDPVRIAGILGALATAGLVSIDEASTRALSGAAGAPGAHGALDGDVESARGRLVDARKMYAAFRYDEAIGHLGEAEALLAPRAGEPTSRALLREVHLLIAMASAAAGRADQSRRAYELAAALAVSGDPDPALHPPAVLTELARVRANAARSLGDLTVLSTPPGAEIVIDGETRGTTPLTVERLSAGAHSLILRSPRHRAVSKQVPIEASKVGTVAFTLEALSGPALLEERRRACLEAKAQERERCLLEIAAAAGARWLIVRERDEAAERFALLGAAEAKQVAAVDSASASQPSDIARLLFSTVRPEPFGPAASDDALPRSLVTAGLITAGGMWVTTLIVGLAQGATGSDMARLAIPVVGPALHMSRARGAGTQVALAGDTLLQAAGIGAAIFGWVLWPDSDEPAHTAR